MIEALIKAGADIDAKDEWWRTALMYAVESGRNEAVDALLNSGADLLATNEIGQTALNVAIDENQPAIADLIAKAIESKYPEQSQEILQKIKTSKTWWQGIRWDLIKQDVVSQAVAFAVITAVSWLLSRCLEPLASLDQAPTRVPVAARRIGPKYRSSLGGIRG
jgi:hypothetical protein